jgi:membrane-bound inhibitor of C-type lysozyme
MRRHRAILTFAAVAMLAACQSPSPHAEAKQAMAPTPAPQPASAVTVTYDCSDGEVVQAQYPDEKTAVLVVKARSFKLQQAVSADGVRYTGNGWQWWTKGMKDGTLAPLKTGETIASDPGVSCHKV